MAAAVPVTVLCGPDDRLRARALGQLVAACPPPARWAVLRNGTGWLPAAAAAVPACLVRYDAGAACGCCIGQVALRATLVRALREAARGVRPWEALIIELGAAAHVPAVLALLEEPAFAGHLVIVRRVAVLDAAAAARTLAQGPAAARERLVAQLALADELLLADAPASQDVVDALRAAATHLRRIEPLVPPASGGS